ncbi:MAG: UDP-N-acetylmuramate--L-alanine ligase [Oscillospiraceae bacterium]|jgi:UDP-N-acetylmuramate--alanine ligase|nr:UDP-N-acetylmuramate--L-alanine ligase [Oscillospiraceae bacterium]
MKIHLIGIGGVSMSPLAYVLQTYGHSVTGSDRDNSAVVEELRASGIPVTTGHLPESVHGADRVIRTAAARDDNPEVIEARRLGIPLVERAEAWGEIMREYPNTICVAGTHGKTTTTGMLAAIFIEAGRDPTVMIGGTLPGLEGGNYRLGKGGDFILEADEYSNSFRFFKPSVAVILNVEYDHPDFFADFEVYRKAFTDFASESGLVFTNEDLGVNAKPIEQLKFELTIPGDYNQSNASAAYAVARHCGIEDAVIRKALKTYTGAKRRFEHKGFLNGARLVEDYAHHPGELSAVLKAARELAPKRLIIAFQPHTYSRTAALLDDFATALSAADLAVLVEIYAAREDNTYNISANDIAKRIPGAEFYKTLPETAERLRAIAKEGDLILVVGAGNITDLCGLLV